MYAIAGPATRELLTYEGRVIVHDNRAEMEFLLPGAQIVHTSGAGMPLLRLRDHPDFAAVRWPLDQRDFIDARS